MNPSNSQLIESVFGGSGEMAARMHKLDWSATPLGPVEQWPQTLRTSLRIVLESGCAMSLCWGQDFTYLYNDGYMPLLGTKHPSALGRPCREVFPDALYLVESVYDGIVRERKARSLVDVPSPVYRNNHLEDCYFTSSISPLPDDSGNVGGILTTVLETTERVLEDRRRHLLRDLASRTAGTRTEDEVWRVSAETLGENCLSLPFAFLYRYRPPEYQAYLAGASVETNEALRPPVIDCRTENLWRLDPAMAKGGVLIELGRRASGVPVPNWPDTPKEACVVPIRLGEFGDPLGFLVAGIHPGRAFDDAYRQFVYRITEQITIGLTSVRAYEQERHAELEREKLRASEERLAETSRLYRELQRTDEELQLQVELLQQLPVSAWTLKPDGTPDFVNRVWLELSGQTLDFVRSYPEAWMTAVHPADREAVSRAFWVGIGSGQGFAMEARTLRARDLTYRWHLHQAVVLRDSEGKVLKFVGTTTDIDDLRLAEARLREGEHESRMIVDSIPGLVALMSPGGALEVVNRQLLEYFGQTFEELKGWGTNDTIHPEDRPRVIDIFSRSIAAGTPYEIAQRYKRADGIYRWFQNRGYPIRDANGDIARWCVLLTDIDDQKRAEEALKGREHDLKLIIDTIPTLSWCNRTDGSNEFLSKSWHEYTGLPPEEAHGWGWQVTFHPEDLPPLMKRWGEMLISGEPGEIEARLRRWDGAYRWFLIRAEPFRDESGTIVRWYGTSTDIEDRKRGEEALRESEQSFRLILDGIAGLVAIMSATGEIEVVNRQVLEYFGRTMEQLKGWSTGNEVHPDDLSGVHAAWVRSLETMCVYDVDHRLRRVDGVYRWFHARGLPLCDPEGRVLRWYVLLTDIHDRMEAEERLRQAQGDLARINRVTTMGELAASLSHEIKQPISGAITNVSTCLRKLGRDEPNLDEVRVAVTRIERDLHRTAEIVDRIRAQFEKGAASKQTLEVNEIIPETVALLRDEAVRHGILVRTELAADLPKIVGDRLQLQQVMMNLILNSIEAMKNVDGIREIIIQSQRAEKEQILVSFSDTGVGLPLQIVEKIFDPFFTTKPHGTGMGLRISRSIIESHGGRLWAVSPSGRGATFQFKLPAVMQNQR